MTQLSLTWPDPGSYVAQLVQRLIAIPPAPASETRIRLSMVRGRGDRQTECVSYDRCLAEAARLNGEHHCPKGCAGFNQIPRVERLYEAIVGRCQSPIADAQGEDSIEVTRHKGRLPLDEAILEALAAGPTTAVQIAKVSGYQRGSVVSRLAALRDAGKVRRVGSEGVRKSGRWERVT